MRKLQRTPRVIRLAVIGVAVFFAVSLIHQQIQITDRQGQLGGLKNEVSRQQAANDALRDQVENGVSDDYLASVAREHGYVLPNERVFKDASGQ